MERKENVTYFLAIFVMVSGVILAFLSFFLSEHHQVDESVLWYVAQCMFYSGALVTGKMYILAQIKKFTRQQDEPQSTFHTRRNDSVSDGTGQEPQ